MRIQVNVRNEFPRPFADLVQQTADRFGLDPYLLWAVMRTESLYRLDALSRAGAIGLMQVMPHTGRRLAGELGLSNFREQQLFNPEVNLMLAAHYTEQSSLSRT